jgi:hypothetical protein
MDPVMQILKTINDKKVLINYMSLNTSPLMDSAQPSWQPYEGD